MELIVLVWRNLTARLTRSTFTWLGIAVATASMVLFLSFGEGLRHALAAEMGNMGPQIRVVAQGTDAFSPPLPELPPEMLGQIEKLAPELGIKKIVPAVVMFRGGFDPASSFLFYGLPEGSDPRDFYPKARVAAGRLDPHPNGAVVGSKKAELNHLTLGKPLRLSREVTVPVVGVMKPAGSMVDSFIFVPMKTLQKVLGTKNYGVFLIQLEPGVNADEVSRKLEEAIPGIDAQSTSEALKYAERAMRIGDLIRFGISLVALVVGGLLVANTVMMSVYERTREFGVMRAIGARRRFIFSLVLSEALFLALSGGLAGILAGIAGSAVINVYTQHAVGLALSAVTPRLALFSLAVALVLGLVAGLIPARNASRIPVTEALGRV
ncbi:ABC transporter permease [Oceanithermus sp.]